MSLLQIVSYNAFSKRSLYNDDANLG